MLALAVSAMFTAAVLTVAYFISGLDPFLLVIAESLFLGTFVAVRWRTHSSTAGWILATPVALLGCQSISTLMRFSGAEALTLLLTTIAIINVSYMMYFEAERKLSRRVFSTAAFMGMPIALVDSRYGAKVVFLGLSEWRLALVLAAIIAHSAIATLMAIRILRKIQREKGISAKDIGLAFLAIVGVNGAVELLLMGKLPEPQVLSTMYFCDCCFCVFTGCAVLMGLFAEKKGSIQRRSAAYG